MSNQSATSSRSTEGANGRKLSRYLILRLRFCCISASAGRPGSTGRRAPAGRTPCGPGTSPPPAGRPRLARSSRSWRLRRGRKARARLGQPPLRSRAARSTGRDMSPPCRRRVRDLAGLTLMKMYERQAPRPTAPPASPAAGWIQMLFETAVAKHLAVGDAIQRDAACQAQLPNRSACKIARDTQHRLFEHRLNGRRNVHVERSQQSLRIARRCPEQFVRTGRSSWSVRCSSRNSDMSSRNDAVGFQVDQVVENEVLSTWARHRERAPSPCIRRN